MRKLDDGDPGRAIWQAHIDAWMDGELSQRAYCAQHGLSPTTFHRWRTWLKDEARTRERRAVARRWRRGTAEESMLPPPQDRKRPGEGTTSSRGRIRRARLKLCLQAAQNWRLHVVFRGGMRSRGPLNCLQRGDSRAIIRGLPPLARETNLEALEG